MMQTSQGYSEYPEQECLCNIPVMPRKNDYPQLPQLTSACANITLIDAANPTPNPDAASVSSSKGDGPTLLEQAELYFSGQQ